MQVGKGRDVGIVQIEVFESKISGGTAISATTRDSFRVCEGMDAARLLSFYHTAAGASSARRRCARLDAG